MSAGEITASRWVIVYFFQKHRNQKNWCFFLFVLKSHSTSMEHERLCLLERCTHTQRHYGNRPHGCTALWRYPISRPVQIWWIQVLQKRRQQCQPNSLLHYIKLIVHALRHWREYMVCFLIEYTPSRSLLLIFYSPGRFFAATFLKIVLVHFLLNYDVKLDPAQLPRDYYFGPDILPGSTAKFLVRERKRE